MIQAAPKASSILSGTATGRMAAGSTPRLPITIHISTKPTSQANAAVRSRSKREAMMAMAEASAAREKFSSQTAPEALAALRQIAESQGRQFQVVLDEALRDYIDRQQKAPSCDDVKDDSLY